MQRDDDHARPVPHTVIKPLSGWRLLDLAELWRHRDLLYFFTWRDVKIRYKQTFLGVTWALLQPFLMMVVFTVFLGRMAKVDSGSTPYPVFVYAGLLPWTFFATAISNAGNSVVNSQQMITKIYFPRLLVPLASIGAAVVDFIIAFSLLIVLMLYYGIRPGWPMLAVPVLLLLACIAAAGVGTLLAALNVAYRDFKYTLPFLVQIWLFATPSVYMNLENTDPVDPSARQIRNGSFASDVVSSPDISLSNDTSAPGAIANPTIENNRPTLTPRLRYLVDLNPMTGLIAFFRAATLGGTLPWRGLVPSVLVISIMFLVGIFYFRRVESRFADVI